MGFSPEAQAAWDRISEEDHERVVSSGFCSRCLATRHFTAESGEMRGNELAVIGKCDVCGARVVKLIEVGE